MRLAVAFVKIPVCFDVSRLTFEVSQFEEAEWLPHPQGYPGNAAIPLIAAQGEDPAKYSIGPSFGGRQRVEYRLPEVASPAT